MGKLVIGCPHCGFDKMWVSFGDDKEMLRRMVADSQQSHRLLCRRYVLVAAE